MCQRFQVWRGSTGLRVGKPKVRPSARLCDFIRLLSSILWLALCKGRAGAGPFSASLAQDRVVETDGQETGAVQFGFRAESWMQAGTLKEALTAVQHMKLSRAPWCFPAPCFPFSDAASSLEPLSRCPLLGAWHGAAISVSTDVPFPRHSYLLP